MKLRRKLNHMWLRAALVVVFVLVSYGYFSSFSPFSANGTIVKENIFLGCVLLGFAAFLIIDFMASGLFKLRYPHILSAVAAFSLVEFLLLGSLSLLNSWAILAAVLFNILLYWYLIRRFNR